MKKIFNRICSSIINLFNRIADQEAERVIKFYSEIFENNPNNKGGGTEKIKTNVFRIM